MRMERLIQYEIVGVNTGVGEIPSLGQGRIPAQYSWCCTFPLSQQQNRPKLVAAPVEARGHRWPPGGHLVGQNIFRMEVGCAHFMWRAFHPGAVGQGCWKDVSNVRAKAVVTDVSLPGSSQFPRTAV